jgi:hypothetical protein
VLVAEKKLGRYLKPEEVVHHIDENKMNNNPDNIMVFATKADHTSFHNRNVALADLLKNENGAYYVPINKRSGFCRLCQAHIDSHATYCKPCWDVLQRKVYRPDREILKDKIRNASFVQIGKEYGVSDNAVKKWCKSYELPYRSKDIKMMSDKDWILL